MSDGLNSCINDLGDAIADLVAPGLESGNPETEESAARLIKAYRKLCESFATENLLTQADPEVLSKAGGLANEIVMAAAMQTEIGIEPLLESLSDTLDLPPAGLKRFIYDVAINLAAVSAASVVFGTHEFQDICSTAIQEKASIYGTGGGIGND